MRPVLAVVLLVVTVGGPAAAVGEGDASGMRRIRVTADGRSFVEANSDRRLGAALTAAWLDQFEQGPPTQER
ncbi:hypothetical protein [Alienimonas californiensis]|uniref:Uncharacterized protein n=1 Tax=Alienimonas californiensis TaxID=2527989 RepID=A0A517PEP0_9PLAN|nr:hypothetical protein [Alienimonas californiensis]QDT17842.1 hypothetical protein CA12_39770 [Alienimonas californiensis]